MCQFESYSYLGLKSVLLSGMNFVQYSVDVWDLIYFALDCLVCFLTFITYVESLQTMSWNEIIILKALQSKCLLWRNFLSVFAFIKWKFCCQKEKMAMSLI